MQIRKSMTLLEVAEQLGVKEATVQRYESGSIKNIKQETIARLATIFNVTPAHIVGWGVKKPAVNDELKNKNIELFMSLSDDKKKQALEFLRFLKGE